MIRYGVFKIFPLQMSYPSLAVLNEPVGQSSPMTLLWTLVGLSPACQIVRGVLEASSGFFLLFRRTALVGAMIGFILMAHVTLLNLCFDVPVKLGAFVITFALAVIIAPDVEQIVSFFLRHSRSELSSSWGPEWMGRSRSIAWAIQTLYIAFILYFFVPSAYSAARQEAANRHASTALTGGVVESAQTSHDGTVSDAPILSAEGLPMKAIYFEPDGRVMARSSDERLWRAGAVVDPHEEKVSLYSGYFDGIRFQATYTYSQPDKDHLRLEPVAAERSTQSTLLLVRIAEPHDYPLLQTRFRWVQEWALER